MKFLTDENIGLEVVAFLRKKGHDVGSITEISTGVSDVMVLAKAVDEKRILITADTDFGELVYHAGKRHAGIVLLRLDDERNANKIRVLGELLEKYADELVGTFVIVTETSVRIRRMS
ncbi:hypothetical protein A2875_02965 [Candidatus Gottesmanbacteria bacterium RIFCSPHIGHO2_01_FULL_46_14]|uniref:DUF5615 domain-containing protein n=2 Tax=Candidatus Gottesmaniibacteriota TaxID=1752720 RepID=A0A1F5ZQW6_9BACT|nr:MAG: hypothetical protein A2875_02965 [Candidatus Gottesmanbacteria bacterium RIFCSPHIGHO2_01_FULL_46_14]OGG30318.1 MAG: hypothetical protein A2971_01855 [Candidatus Gottesmanbacteria bacterium RIFCSPLOWO2_01_FULL_46_21]